METTLSRRDGMVKQAGVILVGLAHARYQAPAEFCTEWGDARRLPTIRASSYNAASFLASDRGNLRKESHENSPGHLQSAGGRHSRCHLVQGQCSILSAGERGS